MIQEGAKPPPGPSPGEDRPLFGVFPQGAPCDRKPAGGAHAAGGAVSPREHSAVTVATRPAWPGEIQRKDRCQFFSVPNVPARVGTSRTTPPFRGIGREAGDLLRIPVDCRVSRDPVGKDAHKNRFHHDDTDGGEPDVAPAICVASAKRIT
jgi:hypothetical protein